MTTFVARDKVDLPHPGDSVALEDGSIDVVEKLETVIWPVSERRPTKVVVFVEGGAEVSVVGSPVPHSWREDRRIR